MLLVRVGECVSIYEESIIWRRHKKKKVKIARKVS